MEAIKGLPPPSSDNPSAMTLQDAQRALKSLEDWIEECKQQGEQG